MSLEQRAGQVLLPFYSGLDHEAHAADIERLHLAGSIIMGDNVPRTAGRAGGHRRNERVTGRLQAAARADGAQLARPDRRGPGRRGGGPAAGAADRVARPDELRRRREAGRWPPTPAGPWPRNSPRLGFNIDFAPDHGRHHGTRRSDHRRPVHVRATPTAPRTAGVAFSQGMLAAGLLPAAKHFPGHGSVSVDSHAGLPVQAASLDQLRARDLETLPGGHRRRAADDHDRAHRRACPGARRARRPCPSRPTRNCAGWGSTGWP